MPSFVLRVLAVLAAAACSHALAGGGRPPTLAVDSPCHQWAEDKRYSYAAHASAAAEGDVRFGMAARCAAEGLAAGGGGGVIRGAAAGFRDAFVASARGLVQPSALVGAIDAEIADRAASLRESGEHEWRHFVRSMVADPQAFARTLGRCLGILALAALCAGILAGLGRFLYLLALQVRYPYLRFGHPAVRLAARLVPRVFEARTGRVACRTSHPPIAAFFRARARLLARRASRRDQGPRRLCVAIGNGVTDLAAAFRNLIARPRAALAYAGLRAAQAGGRGMARLGASLWSGFALALVPVLVVLQQPIADAAQRLAARDRLAYGIEAGAGAVPVSGAVGARAAAERLAVAFETYRGELLAPLLTLDADLERELAELDAAVARWDDDARPRPARLDAVLDARLGRLLDRYGIRRLQLVESLYRERCTAPGGGDCAPGPRLAAYEAEIALLSGLQRRLPAAAVAPVRARIAQLVQCQDQERHDYREGDHDALIKRALSGCPPETASSEAG